MTNASKFIIKKPLEDGTYEEHTINSIKAACEFLKVTNFTLYAIINDECKFNRPSTKHLKDYKIYVIKEDSNPELEQLRQQLHQKTKEHKQQKLAQKLLNNS